MEGENNNMGGGSADMGVEPKGSAGPVVGIIVILVIIILGALYFWGQRGDGTNLTDEQLNVINTQNTTDDTASIEADLNATDIESVDAQINAS